MSNNQNLMQARSAGDDEFYTHYADIREEMQCYINHLDGKAIFCNCDDPKKSNFWKFFYRNFEKLNLKRLLATHYAESNLFEKNDSYCISVSRQANGVRPYPKISNLTGDGSFTSDECIRLLHEIDVVATNPPFSLFRDFVTLMMRNKKDFIAIGPLHALTHDEVWPLVRRNKIRLGVNKVRSFMRPDGSIQKMGNVGWYTNLDHGMEPIELELTATYGPRKHPFYDNYPDAIEVGEVADIPKDYDGLMGVPISYLIKHNPRQFEIIDIDKNLVKKLTGKANRFILKGKTVFARVVIKRK